jgi:hypothetical protein
MVAVGGRAVSVAVGINGVWDAVGVGSTVSIGVTVSTVTGASSAVVEPHAVIIKKEITVSSNLADV